MSHPDRQFPRFALKAEVSFDTEDGSVEGTTSDLSLGGLCAVVNGALKVGSDSAVELALVFSEGATSESLTLFSRVVWCTAMGNQFQLGVSFIDATPEQKSYLEIFLRFLEEGAAHLAPDDDNDGDSDDDDLFGRS